MTNTQTRTYTKLLLVVVLATSFLIYGAPLASADTTPERTRATITRTVDSLHDRASREDTASDDEEEEDDDGGVVVNVNTNNEGQVNINLDTSGFPSGVDITITINGQTVSSSGGQSGGSSNSSAGGADGEDGADGNSGEEEPEEEEPEEEVEEEETDSRYEGREDRDIDDRTSGRR